MARRRIVITGLGTVNPVANTVTDLWTGLMEGKSGIERITHFDPEPFASQIGGEVKNFTGVDKTVVEARESRRMDPFSQFAMQAAIEAVRDSGIQFETTDRNRCGVVVGSGIGGLRELEQQHLKMLAKGPSRISPLTVPKLMGNAASGNISMIWGLRGPNFGCVTACASATTSLGEAYKIIVRDDADIMISGGSEAALTTIGLASFCALKALSTRNDDPHHSSRPFDKNRDGFLLSEGAGILILEEYEHAKARSAKIYAELVGYGASGDGYHITAPDPKGEGACLAMKRCMNDAELNTEDIDYINTHGTSTSLGDLAETVAIKKVFGDYAQNGLVLSSTKSLTGHMLGASGGVELIAGCLAIQNSIIPPTWNLFEPDEGCDLDYCANEPREMEVNTVMSNSFGFGGHNACLLIKKI